MAPIKIIAAIALILATAGVNCCVGGCDADYSEGDRSGSVTKFSRKGLIWKSWEGELVMGGFRLKTDDKGNTSSEANVWEFTVTHEEVVSRVTEAMEKGEPVRIHYRQWLWSPIKMESAYDAVDVAVPR